MNPKSKIFSGRIITGLLIFVLLFNLFPSYVHASLIPGVSEVKDALLALPGIILAYIGSWLNFGLAHLLYIFLWLASWLLSLAGLLFDWALSFNLDTATFDPNSFKGFVNQGWGYVRDIVNLFFIFILLAIAIGTIIGQESYGVKKTLPTLIIMVLLINFSLLFTRYVIESSNSLAYYIYKEKVFVNIDELKKQGRVGDGVDELSIGISGLVLEGLAPQKIYDAAKDIGKDGNLETTRNIITGSILGIIIIVIAAITFFTAAIMLFLRVVILWFAMILAPAALFLWTLPETAGYAKEWLNILIRQSIFLPVLVFMLSLAVYLSININVGSNTFRIDDPLDVLNPQNFLQFIARYILIIIAFNAALVFARSLAEKGTGAIYSYAGQAKGYMDSKAWGAGGWAGGKAWQGASYWPKYGASRGWEALKGRVTRPPKLDEKGEHKLDAQGKAIDKGGILERLARTKVGGLIPGYRKLMEESRAGVQENIDEYKKNLNRLGNYDIKQRHNRVLTVPEERVAAEEILAERKDMSGLNLAYIKDAIKVAERAGRSTGAIERLGYQWGGITTTGDLSLELRKGFEKMKPQNVRDILEEEDAYKAFMEKIPALQKTTGIVINDLNSLANAFDALGNKTVATFLRNKQAEDLMKDIFGRVQKGHPGQTTIPGIPPITP